MDELRDYRFYNQDMIHPNKTAIDIIWEQFKLVWISSKTEVTLKEIAAIQVAMLHRPFNPQGEAHQLFLKNLALKKANLQKKFPRVTFKI
jgi:hypothetical protein